MLSFPTHIMSHAGPIVYLFRTSIHPNKTPTAPCKKNSPWSSHAANAMSHYRDQLALACNPYSRISLLIRQPSSKSCSMDICCMLLKRRSSHSDFTLNAELPRRIVVSLTHCDPHARFDMTVDRKYKSTD